MRWTIMVLMAACATLQAGAAGAIGLEPAERSRSMLDEGAPVLAPFAHVRFCKAYPDDCRADAGATRVSLDASTLAKIRAVNDRVNRSIRAVNDRSTPLGDVWTVAPRKGDCDDFAVTKRRALREAGLPSAALRLLVATTPRGEGHAVLVVATDGGDLVLDNLTNQVRPLAQTGLRPLKVQSATDPRRWLAAGRNAIASRD